MKLKERLAHVRRHPKHYTRTALIFAALVLMFCDVIAALWPAFNVVWNNKVAHVGVGIASILAIFVETIHDEEEDHNDKA